jgi:hypothetical protein
VSDHDFVCRDPEKELIVLRALQTDESTPSLAPSIPDNKCLRSLIHEEEKELDQNPPTVEGEPGIHDVLFGRGGRIYNHEGNIFFRKLVEDHKVRYLTSSRPNKPRVAMSVVHLWRSLTPPGRFLQARSEGNWVEVGDHAARKKTSQHLRQYNKDFQQIKRRKCDEHRRVILSATSNFDQASGYRKNMFLLPTVPS